MLDLKKTHDNRGDNKVINLFNHCFVIYFKYTILSLSLFLEVEFTLFLNVVFQCTSK